MNMFGKKPPTEKAPKANYSNLSVTQHAKEIASRKVTEGLSISQRLVEASRGSAVAHQYKK